MNIYGFSVTEEMQSAGRARMRRPFQAKDICEALVEAGVPEKVPVGRFSMEYCAHRAADRLIQKARKSGEIVRVGNRWEPRQ